MEISYLGPANFLIKSKTGKLTTAPTGAITVEAETGSVNLAGPGEYEAKGFSITGYKNGAYMIEAEDIKIGYKIDEGEVDILITDSWETAKNSHPSIVIPLNMADAAGFIKAAGLEPRVEKKLTVNKLGLPEETELVVFEVK